MAPFVVAISTSKESGATSAKRGFAQSNNETGLAHAEENNTSSPRILMSWLLVFMRIHPGGVVSGARGSMSGVVYCPMIGVLRTVLQMAQTGATRPPPRPCGRAQLSPPLSSQNDAHQ